jgi:hypothetical protein
VKIIPPLLVLRFAGVINESVDYIIYGSVSALGFAFMENLLYFDPPGYVSITARAITAVPFHMVLTSIAMYGLARFQARGRNRWKLFARNFAVACVVHGLYDFWLLTDGALGGLKFLSMVILAGSVVAYSRMIVNALKHSRFYREQAKDLQDRTSYLGAAITVVLVLQYTAMAFSFGPSYSNGVIYQQVLSYWLLVWLVVGMLGQLSLESASEENEIRV